MGPALAWAMLVAAGGGTVLAALAQRGWPYELACHFRAQYAGLALVGMLLLAAASHWWAALLAAAVLVVNGQALGPLYRRAAPRPAGRSYRVLLSNVCFQNRSMARVERLIRRADPDVIVLVEATKRWVEELRSLEADYPFSKMVLRSGGFGIACFSRLPIDSAQAVRIGRVGLPSLVLRLNLNGQPTTLIATHPLSPVKCRHWQRRDRQLEALAECAGRQSGPLLLMGDLNTTPWSPSFRHLLSRSRLRDSRAGFGLQTSWPVWVPWLRIPIDHCLVSREVAVHRRARGPAIGSDHFPLLVDFSLASPVQATP